jgi:hypothetical protein
VSEPEVSVATKRCRYCRLQIDKEAEVCHHCLRSQRFQFRINQVLELTALAGIFVSLVLCCLSYLQYDNARRYRVEAGKALTEASSAREAASKSAAESRRALAIALGVENQITPLFQSQERLRIQITVQFGELFSSVCQATGGSFDANTYGCMLRSGKEIVYRAY